MKVSMMRESHAILPIGIVYKWARYDAACEKNTSARPPALIRSILPQHSLIGRPTVGPA